jgi:hypothetical protein
MRTLWLFLLAPLIAGAQFPPPQMSGVLLECDTNVAAGELAVRAPDNQVYRFQFDAKTFVERDSFTGTVARLVAGDKLEVESDPVAGSLLRYARTIRVLVPHAMPRLTLADNRLRAVPRRLPELTLPLETITFAGVISRLNAERLVLHTRAGEQTVLIRKDTRYIDNGDTVEAADLQPNMRVFVRAARNLYEQVEAYQVIWGTIREVK